MKIAANLPSIKDISPTDGLDLDENCALDHFYGFDQAAALQMFRDDADCLHIYMADFVHMGDVGFSYYLPAFVDYIGELPDDQFAEEVPDSVDYILIRFADRESFPIVLKELIKLVHDRLQKMSGDLIPTLTARLKRFLILYRKAEQVGGHQPPTRPDSI